ncbi:MAG TPA: deoxyuridine 5'-triphosphate nucleotidohydrolase [Thermomicrobiales bacterium]|jgi:dUTP pyrophosphatase|nr:deoxyuridine 5'-triphosphate nucleotidohydrolase [Thermomicrobiales bacterium]
MAGDDLMDGMSSGRGGWSGDRIRAAITGSQPLIEHFVDLDEQIQPNGFDLTLARIGKLVGPGVLPADSGGRQLPTIEDIPLPGDGSVVHLEPGPYQIGFNEVVRMPLGTMALGRARSSLNRSGVTIHTAVWDAGYVGRSTALLSVLNPAGFAVGRDARVLQLIFFDLSHDASAGYSGAYQNENMTAPPGSGSTR